LIDVFVLFFTSNYWIANFDKVYTGHGLNISQLAKSPKKQSV